MAESTESTVPETMEEKLEDQIFKNEIVVEAIFAHLDKNPMNDLGLRLVSHAFNSVCTRQVRKSHQKLEIAYYPSENENRLIVINGLHLHPNHIFKYLETLDKTFDVKVDKLNVERMPRRYNEVKERLHSLLVNLLKKSDRVFEFVGMQEFCFQGCAHCDRWALQCQEYGPVQLCFLLPRDPSAAPVHYKTLHVNDAALFGLAVTSRESAEDKEDCLAILDFCVSANISCDRLVFHLDARHPDFPAVQEISFPRDVIDTLVKKWRVQHVELKMYDHTNVVQSPLLWGRDGYLEAFQLDGDVDIVGTMANEVPQLKSVLLNLEHSPAVTFGIACGAFFQDYRGIVASTRRLFPTNHIFVALPKTVLHDYDSGKLRNVLNAMWRCGPTMHLEVAIFATAASRGDLDSLRSLKDYLTAEGLEWSCDRSCDKPKFDFPFPIDDIDYIDTMTLRVHKESENRTTIVHCLTANRA